jgi:hypothetical protein
MSADLRAKINELEALAISAKPGGLRMGQRERDILIEAGYAAAKALLEWKPEDLPALDRLEQQLRVALRSWEFLTQDKVKARKTLLDSAVNERDRAIYKILIKQTTSTRGKRSGNRKNVMTQLGDRQILGEFKNWQTNRSEPGSDRQFAAWRHQRETKKDATERDIRRITQHLRDARKRVADQSA